MKGSSRGEENRAFYNCLSTKDGTTVIEILDRMVSGNLLRKHDGGVDEHATMYAIGQHDIVKQIKQRIEDGKMAR
ncbi:MAG: hypothetical protein DRQ42_06640 [Gammaproteobacteria bacterium]|nr:MAG: hypothetical protein DRQ42_06640 [Gammaproteobacteria bacterium]